MKRYQPIRFLVLIFSLLFSMAQAQTNVVPDDVEFQALKDIYDNLGGATWTVKTNWPAAGSWPTTATSSQFKTWAGVTVTNGDVTAIGFVNNNLQGTIPSSIGNLTSLQSLAIANNPLLTSSIPASIGSLTKLTNLQLYSNKLAGTVPSSIGQLTSLVAFRLNSNNFSGALPAELNQLVNLTSLDASVNGFTGAIPDLSALTNLTSLTLANNSFDAGPIPSWLSQLTKLLILNLSTTHRNGTIPDAICTGLPNLQALVLTVNQLTGAIPSSICSLTQLTQLQLSFNQLTGSLPDCLGNTHTLLVLRLEGNQFTGNIPASYGNLTNLNSMYLHTNQLTGKIPDSFGNLTNLALLYLYNNHLTGAIPPSFSNLTKMTDLQLYNNQLIGPIPTSISNLTSLTKLDLHLNQLSGTLPAGLGSLTKLTYLALNNNQFSGAIPTGIGNLTLLTDLYLDDNQLTGAIPDSFGNLVNVTRLYLQANQLSGSIPSTLGNMIKVQYFYAYNNQLTGSLPTSLSNLSQMYLFYVYNNKLTGTFPAYNWPVANIIRLDNNFFTGPFPDVTAMAKLSSVVANNNQFTTLPPSLLSLPLLVNVNFQGNQLIKVPNFASQVNKANLSVTISSNRLDLAQLDPLVGAGLKFLASTPQNNVQDVTIIAAQLSTNLRIPARTLSTSTSITWEKQVNGAWTNPTSPNQDNTQATYYLSSLTTADEGIYRWKMTSTKMSGTTVSDPINVKTPARIPLDNWAFQYQYDGRDRMIARKAPGADWVYMVYDDRNRVVMTQDGNQRPNLQWTFTKYDALNRPVMTGTYTHTAAINQGDMQTIVNTFYTPTTQVMYDSYIGGGTGNVHGYDNKSFPQITDPNTCLTVTYYDNYSFRSLFGSGYTYVPNDLASQIENGVTYKQADSESASVTGQVTGTRVKTLPTGSWLNSVTYYDDKYRTIQTISSNFQGGKDRVSNLLDFVGNVLASKSTHNTSTLQWTRLNNVNTTTTDLINTSTTNAWGYSGAASVQTIPAGASGWMEVTVPEVNTSKIIGFSASKSNYIYSTVNYGLYLNTTNFYAYENGLQKCGPVPIVTGDVLRIERNGSTITYLKNGTLIYSSASSSTSSLLIDADIASPGGTIANIHTSIGALTPDVTTTHRFVYDHMGRLLDTWHSVNGQTEVLLSRNQYNELGQLIDKKLHSADQGSSFSQSTDYRYNIQGWLTSINNSQLAVDATNDDTNDLFGMNLSYDGVVAGINNTPQYNGNVSAIKWSTNLALDETTDLGYKYSYDPLNRLTAATYLTHTSGVWTNSTAFAENSMKYDLNGNIQNITRTDANGAPLDQLTYDYGSGNTQGNQHLGIRDDGDLNLGFADNNLAGSDYTYDKVGNIVVDKNKGISGITYNYLNLPQKVTMNSGSYIQYTYDAIGRKLGQQVFNSSGVSQKKSDYAGEFYYENDALLYINHEQGRVVMTPTLEYQYFLTDHLGNVRTTFTTKTDTETSLATMETANAATESGEFLNYNDAIVINAQLFDHTNRPTAPGLPNGGQDSDDPNPPPPSAASYNSVRLTGITTNAVIGLGKSLSVMPGDKIDVSVYAKYLDPDQSNWSSAADFLTAVASMGNATTGSLIDGGATGIQGSNLFPLSELLNNATSDDDGGPMAYLNYLVFDKNYMQIGGGHKKMSSIAKEDGTQGVYGVAHELLAFTGADEIVITKPGYVYIYLSNENPTPVDVFFDDFQVVYTKSPVIQTDDYYAGGARYNSYSRENSLINKFTMQGTETMDDLALNLQDFGARSYDPYTWRTGIQDPHADNHLPISPYSLLNNNPVSTIDPTGMDDWGIIDEEEAAVSTYAQEEQYAADYAMQYESEAAGEESNAMGALASMSDYLNEENDKLAAETGVSLTEEDERDPWPKNVPKDATFLGQNEYHESVYVSADGGTRYFVNDNGENYSKKMNLPDMNYFDHLPGGKYFWNTYMGQDIIKAFPFLADPNTRQALGSKLSDTFFEGLVDDIWGKIFPWPIPIEVPDDFPMPVDNPLIRTPK